MYKRIVKLRSLILVYLTHHMALPLLKLLRKNDVFPYSGEELHFFAPGTLGNQLAEFLDVNNLQLLPYYARHDIKHILLEYETTDEGEGSLQCFMLGNGHLSFPVAATVVYCFLTMPEHWHLFRKAYRRGKAAVRISDWKWFELLEEPVVGLRRQIIPVV
ncbi:hypothetical protein [Ferruginibacter sp. HRS2-29]|uniref:hypothetical protein n=1 Tax=Ferruginibacter sp. HRS2-29 TaxID=2487334 RepID=UPI0020CE5443|nr:hypothetical protein [Ferruginibacter sp. HRS2-29]MCP9751697.1 hypothetical protein [Ferruginibacter sp. HRS2-29]